MKSFLVAAVAAIAQGIELTPDNWEKETSGKSVFIKFLAPWCGHCKNMKPAWDQLMAAYKGNPSSLVADVDCTAAGKPLCDKNGVRGYPSIKYGEPGKLQDYQGGRDFNALKTFADNNLGPKCGPENLDLCKEAVKSRYEELMKLESGPIEDQTKAKRKELKDLEEEIEILKNTGRYVRKQEREAKAATKKAEKEAKKKEEKKDEL